MTRKIILALDGSKQAEEAYLWFVNGLHREGDDVHLVTAHEAATVPLPLGFFGADPVVLSDDWLQGMTESYNETKWMIESYQARMAKLGVKATVHVRTSQGSPGEAIVEVANEIDADMIAMGSRGQGVLRRTFLGSVSDYVLHHAECPVLVVKSKPEECKDNAKQS